MAKAFWILWATLQFSHMALSPRMPFVFSVLHSWRAAVPQEWCLQCACSCYMGIVLPVGSVASWRCLLGIPYKVKHLNGFRSQRERWAGNLLLTAWLWRYSSGLTPGGAQVMNSEQRPNFTTFLILVWLQVRIFWACKFSIFVHRCFAVFPALQRHFEDVLRIVEISNVSAEPRWQK